MSKTLRQTFPNYKVYTRLYDSGDLVCVRQIVFQPRRKDCQVEILVGGAFEYRPSAHRIKNKAHGVFWNIQLWVPREHIFVAPNAIMIPQTVAVFPKEKDFWTDFNEIREAMGADLEEVYQYDLATKSLRIAKIRYLSNVAMATIRTFLSAARMKRSL